MRFPWGLGFSSVERARLLTGVFISGIPREEPCTALACPNGMCFLAGEAALNEYLRVKTVTFEY